MRARSRVVSNAGSAARRSSVGARLAVIAAALLNGADAGCSRNKPSGLLIDVESELSVPREIDHIRIDALQSDGVLLLHEEHDLGEGSWSLPAEILLNPAGNALPVTVRAVASKNGEVRIERSAVTQIPLTYLGRLHLPLDYLCTDAVTATGDSTCGSGRTCDQGTCIDIQIPPSKNVDADAGSDSIADAGAASLDAGATADDATCFDVLACFANARPAVVEEVTCSIALPSTADPDRISLAIELAPGSSGICDQKACWVVIAQGDEGWTIRGDRVQLPEEVCLPRPGQRNLTVVMSTRCATNAGATPLCGTPPAATTPIDSPAPPALLGVACIGFGSQPCGNCGVQTRQCVNGAWQAWSRCNGEGACAPGVSQPCGSMGTQVCANSCQWSACTGQICYGPATQNCGQCGTQSRTCDNGSWSEWSACTNQGECALAVMRHCGSGGAQVCGPSCQWSACTELCAVANGGCDPLTQCTNQGFTRACGPCPGGYTGSGETACMDVDECLDANGGCDPLTTCTNTPGGRTCGACPPGYTGTGEKGCTDIDECMTNNGWCDPLSLCTNLDGSRSCGACPVGYSGDGATGCFCCGCGSRTSATAYASWPMPNDRLSELPNAQAYDTATSSIITDLVTGLMWQRDSGTKTYSWTDALSYCEGLSLDGYDDWRLPTRIELFSIADFSRVEPTIDTATFKDFDNINVSPIFWSSSAEVGGCSSAWAFHFNSGDLISVPTTDPSASFRARCVRSTAPAPNTKRYAIGATVVDLYTGLEWQRYGGQSTWSGAGDFCASFGSGWRLPSVKELETLVDDNRALYAIDTTIFFDVSSPGTWSSSSYVPRPGARWTVGFNYGVNFSLTETLTVNLRCVRNVPSVPGPS
jgi:hypothetical protein